MAASNSSTILQDLLGFQLTYGGGTEVYCDYAWDIFSLGSLQITTPTIFGTVYQLFNWNPDQTGDGVFGMPARSPVDMDNYLLTFPSVMNSTDLDAQMFAIWYRAQSVKGFADAFVDFGAPLSSRYTGGITFAPLLSNVSASTNNTNKNGVNYNYGWIIAVDYIGINGVNFITTNSTFPAQLDSGTSFVSGGCALSTDTWL